MPDSYDIVVVGAGHAGCEAALAGARMGFSTLLITMNLDTIAQMSCNPAIGGLAKGHLVKEIDALGGEMARVTDLSCIQFRMLNTKKGPAVWAPRAQTDKKVYQFTMKSILEKQNNLFILQDTVEEIFTENNIIKGVATRYKPYIEARAVIVTPGTFMKGLIHIGFKSFESGRFGEFASIGLSESLHKCGLKLARLKTGTPPRILRSSIDFSKVTEQPGDEVYIPFSRKIKEPPLTQVSCYITYSTAKTKQVINSNLDKSPLYSGKIKGIGPRYCPSIEDKIVKFPDKEKHQIFLEPEGINTEEIYVNGASSSLPQDVQEQIIRSIEGLENAVIMRYAYGIEYDFVTTDQISPSLETRSISGLYLAGQINGTSGYEEAAAQGLLAAINAGYKLLGKQPLIIGRDEGYIGVMIDDLITKIPQEPYRMFTSRAEFRLLLRQDNAYQRLAKYGFDAGLIDPDTYSDTLAHINKINNDINRLNTSNYRDTTAAKLLKRQDYTYEKLISDNIIQKDNTLSELDIFEVETEIKYEGYIAKQKSQADKIRKYEQWVIPDNFNYSSISGLRKEAKEKLIRSKPVTIGQALRIPGVNPVDVQLVMIFIEREKRINNQNRQDI